MSPTARWTLAMTVLSVSTTLVASSYSAAGGGRSRSCSARAWSPTRSLRHEPRRGPGGGTDDSDTDVPGAT